MSELFPVKCSCGHSERQHILGICIMCNCKDGPGWKKPVPAPAEPVPQEECLGGEGCSCNFVPAPASAEYTCPRCGSNVSTHICMGEPVAGETRKCNAPIEQGENVQLCCKRPLGHIGRHSIHNLPAPAVPEATKCEKRFIDPTHGDSYFCKLMPGHDGPCEDGDWLWFSESTPAPSVAVPEGEAKPTRTVTHQMARDAFRKMHDALYNNAPIPSLSIPARLDDADIVLSDYICQQRDLATPPTNQVSTAQDAVWLVRHHLGADALTFHDDARERIRACLNALQELVKDDWKIPEVLAGGVSTGGMTARIGETREAFERCWLIDHPKTWLEVNEDGAYTYRDTRDAFKLWMAGAEAFAHVLAEKGK